MYIYYCDTFLWLKITKSCQKWVYREMVDIFLLEICPRLLQNTLLSRILKTVAYQET